MESDDLPKEFDIVILGTGVAETITAAAFSRIGLKVLHLDRNDYYGGAYGNFNLQGIQEFKKKNEEAKEKSTAISELTDELKTLLEEGETAVSLPVDAVQGYNIKCQFHVRERTEEEEKIAEKAKNARFMRFHPVTIKAQSEPVTNSCEDVSQAASKTCEETTNNGLLESEHCSYKQLVTSSGTLVSPGKKDGSLGDDIEDKSSLEISLFEKIGTEESGDGVYAKDQVNSQNSGVDSKEKTTESGSGDAGKKIAKEWTAGDLKDEWRRYCLDLSPKILHCCGDLVQLLIKSDVSRYCEFRTVSRVLTMIKGELQQVPCSRADVFSSRFVSLIEKRLMMKFLQFAADYESKPEEYKDYADKPFIEFLKSKNLSANIQHFIQHAIAMVTDLSTTEESLKRTQKFLQSLGKYGNTAFLFPLYGFGELPQAFSRLSAVFGGVYCLMKTATHLITDKENKCCGVMTSCGKKISCKYLIAEQTYLPLTFLSSPTNKMLSRAIYITNRSIKEANDDQENCSLLNYVCSSDSSRPIAFLELPDNASVCPKGVYLVHLTRQSTSDDPEDDFKDIRETLFSTVSPVDTDKPQVLWSMYFHLPDRSRPMLADGIPQNVLVASGGGDDAIDLDHCVQEAEKIFKTVCPDEEFLPTPPKPEDIIHVDDTEAPVTIGQSEFEVNEGTTSDEEVQSDVSENSDLQENAVKNSLSLEVTTTSLDQQSESTEE